MKCTSYVDTFMLKCPHTQMEQEKGCFFCCFLDHTKGVCHGVEACEGIKGTKQGDERAEAWAKKSVWMVSRVREALKSPSSSPVRTGFAKEEGKSGVSSFSSLFPFSPALPGPDRLVDRPVRWAAWRGGQVCVLSEQWMLCTCTKSNLQELLTYRLQMVAATCKLKINMSELYRAYRQIWWSSLQVSGMQSKANQSLAIK